MEKGLHVWELENGVKLVDPKRDALYNYDAAAQKAAAQAKPWAKDRNYFKHVRISAVALIKMMLHARSGGRLEIMGLMQGYVDGDTFIVTDAFRLPVEGTETRVNVQDEANEYIIEYLDLCRAQGKQENVVGWYHSHPGYGCWLSGIDVDTQSMQQQFQDPFLAVVIDPDRTVSAGKVEIGAFRTFPPGTNGSGNAAGVGTEHEASNAERFQTVPLEKAEQFGAHANRYYSLEVSHFKSSLDAQLLESLWHKYWVQTLSQNPLLTNRDYGAKQMLDMSSKMGIVASNLTKSRGQQSFGSDRSTGTTLDNAMDQSTNDVKLIASRDRTGLLASEVKAKIFNGLGTNRD
ncbi:COP9 signalosome catalytic subunit rri1 [Claviceps purpurea]|nr:COP9 signalosome catalytic subunit rri1 [Claviceps purpurea]KAG6315781.1 COP9 signalosome catalytic subunit rri1 [Claviceps purpurea]